MQIQIIQTPCISYPYIYTYFVYHFIRLLTYPKYVYIPKSEETMPWENLIIFNWHISLLHFYCLLEACCDCAVCRAVIPFLSLFKSFDCQNVNKEGCSRLLYSIQQFFYIAYRFEILFWLSKQQRYIYIYTDRGCSRR